METLDSIQVLDCKLNQCISGSSIQKHLFVSLSQVTRLTHVS